MAVNARRVCRCSGRVTVTQYMNCNCDKCNTYVAEVFEYCCRECGEYGNSYHFTIDDPDSDCSYSWVGIG